MQIPRCLFTIFNIYYTKLVQQNNDIVPYPRRIFKRSLPLMFYHIVSLDIGICRRVCKNQSVRSIGYSFAWELYI